jgi:two-component system, cell cycle response regulator DivK
MARREGQGGTVLIIEDEEETRRAYRAILEQAGWAVAEAAGGDQGVRLALADPPLLVVVDISIPGLDGWETTRRIKGDARTRLVPVLAITAHALEEDRQRAAQVGCDGYLVKPIAAQELLAEVSRLAGDTRDG